MESEVEPKRLGKECFVVDAILEIIENEVRAREHRGAYYDFRASATQREVGSKWLGWDEEKRRHLYDIKEYDISRKTKWKALKNLEEAGYIELHGKRWKLGEDLKDWSSRLEELFTKNLKRQLEYYKRRLEEANNK